MIQFLLNEQLISIDKERADLTLLNYLREEKKLTGTKEGCASGDCGACTVVIAEISSNHKDTIGLKYKAINSCVIFLSALHGKQLITVEHIGNTQMMHPVQQAMVDANATQCGFCTPGFVMSLFALYQHASKSTQPINRADVIKALSGNLCRCTGYKPIIEAALNACGRAKSQVSHTNKLALEESTSQIIEALEGIKETNNYHTENLFLPHSRQELAEIIKQYPEAHLTAGSTDLALLHTQNLQVLPKLISVKYVPELNTADVDEHVIKIGAACTLSDIEDILLRYFPSLDEVIERFASVPIRNQATLGGNIANASPIGDMPPVLLALNANIVLDNGEKTRTLALKEFFLGYKKTLLAKGEWLKSIEIPLPNPQQKLAVYKISKRFEDDISAVCTAFNLSLKNGIVTKLSTGFGGVAATPSYSIELETALLGKIWNDEACIKLGQEALESAFNPIDDVRASAIYRKQMLINLWHRFWLESNIQKDKRISSNSEHIPIRLMTEHEVKHA